MTTPADPGPAPLTRPLPPGIERVDPDNVANNPRFQNLKPHRCNPHLDDVLEGLFQEDLTWRQWRATVGVFASCMRSRKGQEPPRFDRKAE